MSTQAYQKLQKAVEHVFTVSEVPSTFNKSPVNVTLDTSGQCTLKWGLIEMRMSEGTLPIKLPAGECNLYTFPAAVLDGSPTTLSGPHLDALGELLVALAIDPSTADMMLTPDAVGAYPIHALLVANTEQSLKLAMRLFQSEPGAFSFFHSSRPAGTRQTSSV